MARHNETGKKGEQWAAAWLKENGYIIIEENWRHSYYELDIIASRQSILHFIEVKTRSNMNFGYPEECVSKKKFSNLMNAAEEYLFHHPQWQRVQYDILSITLFKGQPVEFF